MSYKKITASLALLIILCYKGQTQNGNYQLRNVITPSPTTASLGKYGEVPVGLFTGIPNVSIPIYEIKDGPLSLPISLSYHAGGVKVEEIASSVGLGWTLNAGGVVSRQQRGRADEFDWVTDPQNRIANILQNGTQGQINSMTISLENGTIDGEPDIYNYNSGGLSGKFFFDQAGVIYNYPAKNVKITPRYGNFSGDGWKIISEDGTIYEFHNAETVTSISCKGGDSEAKTAWYLTKITSADGKRQISFTYENVYYSAIVFLGQTKYFTLNGNGECLSTDPPSCSGTNLFNTPRLKRIDFSEGYVKFNYNNSRQDIYNGDDKSLDQIEIYSASNTLIRKYDLAYSYFGSGPDPDSKRLKLTSVTEKSATNSPKPPFIFTYEESVQVPNRHSLSVDHWGYYNGKTNTSYISSFKFTNPYTGLTYNYNGADRNANPATMQAGILKKIQYPTGGETEFTYETNTTSDSRITPVTYDEYYSYSLNQAYTSLSSPYETGTFTVPAQGADVKFTVSGLTSSNSYCNYEVNLHCYLIKDNNISTPYTEITDGTNGVSLSLPAGTYKFRFTFNGCYTGNLNFSINLHNKIPVLSEMGKRPVGGLRIKQLEDRAGGGIQPVVRKYRYETDYDPTQSSGVLLNFPEYGYVLTAENRLGDGTPGNPCYLDRTCVYLVRQSKTNYPLATSQGSYVGYWNVIEDLENNGEVWHRYNANSTPNPLFPFAPVEASEWQRGAEISTKYYAKNTGQLVLSKEVNYGYISTNLNTAKGYMVGRNFIITGSCTNVWANAPLTTYDIIPQFWALNYTNERQYDQSDPSKFIETTMNYTYDPNHYQVSQVKTSTTSSVSNVKDEIVTVKKYPQDYSFPGSAYLPEALGIKLLKDLHIVNLPIEEYSYRQKRNTSTNVLSDQRVTNSTIITYKENNPYPAEVFRLETTSPFTLSAYGTGSSIGVSGNNNILIKNSNSTIANAFKSALLFSSYDDKGNLTQQQKANDVLHSYIWGYNKKYPVAEVRGISHSQAMSVLSQTVLDNPSGDAALRTEINKIRNNFPLAQTVAYTYHPFLGITSQTDLNNRSIFYEYDNFNRLTLIRDQDNNILKRICYNYTGQVENCDVACTNTTPNWQNTATALRCQQSGGQNTGYQEQEQKDMNPCSATFNQTQWVVSGYNATACPPPSQVTITYNNIANTANFSAQYTNNTTQQVYNFNIPGSGSGTLGTVPPGTYTVVVSRPNQGGFELLMLIGTGCTYQSVEYTGTFYNVIVDNCHHITIEYDF